MSRGKYRKDSEKECLAASDSLSRDLRGERRGKSGAPDKMKKREEQGAVVKSKKQRRGLSPGCIKRPRTD